MTRNKFLERKFLIAMFSPVVSIVLNALGLLEYLNEYVNYAVDLVLWTAPIMWMWIEGALDQQKIKSQHGVTQTTSTSANFTHVEKGVDDNQILIDRKLIEGRL